MGNLTKKTITRGAVVALALSAGAATTANAAVTRVSGTDRYATATKVAESWPTTATTAILAAGEGHNVDALTVAPLAKQKNAPIVLVDTAASTASIVAKFANYTTVYIANGTGVVSPSVETALTAAGKTVIRLGGATRYATALNIAKALGTATDIVIANGDDDHLVDSLSIASIAAAKGMPIFLTSANSLDSAEATFAKGLAAKNAYVLGGKTLVSDAAVTGLGTVTRLAGAGRYETNAAVVTAFKSDAALDLSNVYVASGEDANLIDSLVAAPLAGLKKAPIVFAHNSLNADVKTLLTGVIDKNTNITVLGGTGAVSATAFNAVEVIQDPSKATTPTGVLAVSSVAATGATTFKVTFNQAPADTSKVTFTVLQGTVPVAVTAGWNSSKTEATLTSAANFAAGDYTVNVKNDTTDLGTSNLTVVDQKIAKINITSTKLGVANKATGEDFGKGYATYQVLDQFGNDITLSSLANGLTFQSGVGSIEGKNGVIKLTPTLNLLTFTSGVVITAYDSTSGVSTSATLAVSTQLGTLSDINLSALTNADKKVLTAGDTASLFYATYTATDLSGNPTTDYDTVRNGLILDSNNQLSGTSSYITATVVQDPTDSKKAAIQIQVKATNDTISTDLPIVITAMTYTGKTSTLNVTLKKASTIDKITLASPAYNIAVNEDKEIPFTAVDQNGTVLTKLSDINVNGVSISGAHWDSRVDGTAVLKAGSGTNKGFSTSGQQVITATTPTGKYSSINLNIQKKVAADSLNLSSTILIPTMQAGGALQKIDFGQDKGGLSVKDQYGRDIDMTTGTGTNVDNGRYYVTVSSDNTNAIVTTMTGVSVDGHLSTGTDQIRISSVGIGTATVTFKLYSTDTTDQNGNDRTAKIGTPVDTKTQTFSVIKNDDIKDYTIDAVTAAIYTDVATSTKTQNPLPTPTSRQQDYKANPKVYGKTSSGSKVVLAGTPILGASVDSGDFQVFNITPNATAYDAVKVAAYKFDDSAKTGSSTNLQVSLMGADGQIHAVSTAIKSTTVDPVAASMGVNVDTDVAGVSLSGDTITLDHTLFATGTTYSSILGNSLAKMDKNGVAGTTQHVYIYANDQYGKNAMQLSNFIVVPANATTTGSILNGHSFTLDTDGTILTNTTQAGDTIVVSGIVGSFVKTIRIILK